MTTGDPTGGSKRLHRRHVLQGLGLGGAAAVIPWRLTGPAHAQSARTLRVRFGSDISILDPALIFQIENQTVAGHVFNGLVKYDQASNEIVPDLATGWEVSSDGTSYTFRLREGVTFHKGYGPCTAEDVKFTFDRVLDEATGSRYRGQLAGLEVVEVVDPLTVRFGLAAPNAGFLHKVCAFNQGWIVSRRAMEEMGEDARLNPIGTGPFVFESWTPGTQVELSANPDYFAGTPAVAGVLFRIVRDEMASAIALENNELDIFFSLQQPEVIERLRGRSGITVLDRAANNTVNLVLNTTVAPLNDARVRQAMLYAMNRDALVQGFFRGTKFPATSVLTETFQEFGVPSVAYPYDPDRAKALLAEAGVGRFDFVITTVALNPFDRLVVPLANDLQEVGINATIQVVERGAYVQARASGNVQSCITAVVGPPDPDSPLVTLFSTASFPPGLNTSRYDQVDDLLAEAARTLDADARKAVYARILERSMTDVPVLPLYADRLFVAHGDAVQGFVQNSLFTMDSRDVSLGA
ncbi:MAG: ABC transporter substrate-binding protein [Pseudomonadota bacterium]